MGDSPWYVMGDSPVPNANEGDSPVPHALKHGQATHVYFVTDPTETGFRLRIANDGKPFDVSRALIPEAGHFGLTGMRERARRSGIAISWQSNDRHTVVTLEVRT